VTAVDPFVREAVEALAARDRTISSLSRDVATLLTALAVHEGGDVSEVSFRRLGRRQDLTALWGDDPHPPTTKESPWLGL
jgi:hypothetical protein